MEPHRVLWLAACSLLSDYVFYLKLVFPSTNQAFHQVACLFAFEAFNLTCQCQPEASSWSHILKWLWLNSPITLSTVGTRCYQLLCAMDYKIVLLLPKSNPRTRNEPWLGVTALCCRPAQPTPAISVAINK